MTDVDVVSAGQADGVSWYENLGVMPVITIDDVEYVEQDGDVPTSQSLEVELSAPAPAGGVTVDYATAPGTALAGSDYVHTSGQVVIAEGQTTGAIDVEIVADDRDEPTQTFTVNLSNPTNADLGDDSATVSITDDDTPPTISIDDVTAKEGKRNASTPFTFTVTLSQPSDYTVTVNWATADGNAKAGKDYTAGSGTVTFAPGADLTETVTVMVHGDRRDEKGEKFFVNLTAPNNASIVDGQGLGKIKNDDA